jgi:hypothetical protein
VLIPEATGLKHAAMAGAAPLYALPDDAFTAS